MEQLKNTKIARISTVPYFVVTQLKQQIEHLASIGAQVYIITSEDKGLSRFKKNNLHIVLIDIPRGLSPIRDLRALIKLFLFFHRSHFDIVHSTTPKAGLLTAVAGFLVRIPVRLHTFTGQPWINLTGLIRYISIGSDWLIGRLNTRCYADSKSQAHFLVTQKIIQENKISVIGHGSLAGVDFTRFNPKQWPLTETIKLRNELKIPEDSFIILFVGRITRDKGIFELIESFQNVLQKGCNTHLVLVGPLDEESGGVSSVSKKFISEQPGTHYAGYTDCPEQYMAMADILCLPSYREGFGTVVIEAAAMETPTVGTEIYGLSDAVVNNKTGLLVPPRDVVSLTEALYKLIHNREKCQKLGTAARKHAELYFDSHLMNVLLSEEYSRLIRKHFNITSITDRLS